MLWSPKNKFCNLFEASSLFKIIRRKVGAKNTKLNWLQYNRCKETTVPSDFRNSGHKNDLWIVKHSLWQLHLSQHRS